VRLGRLRIRLHRAPKDEQELIETAWGIIANAGWDGMEKTTGWQDAAIRWREDYHRWLARTRTNAQ
jgi:hypothetical protein